MDMKSIFDETELKHLKLKNRLFRSATWDGLVNKDGTLIEEIYEIYEELAAGGVGAIVTGLTDVSPLDWARPGNMRLCDDALIPDYKHLTDIVHQYNCRIIPQINLNKYMKQGVDGKLVEVDINELTHEEIKHIISLFADAAVRAKKAGFDAIQIHCCFNRLLNRSFNPRLNHRTDKYGGNIENRARLTVEVLKAIRKRIPDIHITAKIGFDGDRNNPVELEDFALICQQFAKHGMDSMEISDNEDIVGISEKTEAGFLPIALAVRKHVDIPIILVGGHRQPEKMERLLNETSIDYLSLSRPFIREPDLPNRWQSGDNSPALCITCDECYNTHGKRCIFNVKS